ncbi:hypothetical protein [Microcoleus sp. D3_18_C4]
MKEIWAVQDAMVLKALAIGLEVADGYFGGESGDGGFAGRKAPR